MYRIAHAFLLGFALLGAGCASDSPQSASSPPAAVAMQPVAATEPGKASITLTRPSAYIGGLMSVPIDLNGAHLVDLSTTQSYTASIPPGETTLSVAHWSAPGRYTVRFNAEAGKRYAFEVSPRDEQFAASLVGGLAGSLVETAASGERSGPFKIVRVQ
jgi:hypothetical protein